MASPAEVAELFHLMRKEEFDRAIKLAPRLVAAHPGDNDLVACHAFLLANAGRFEECAKLCERATKEVRPSVEFYKTYSQYRLGQLDAAAEVGERSSDERLQVLAAQTKFRRAALLASRRSPFTPGSQEGEAVATARATALEAAQGYASIARAATGALDEAQVAGNMVAALAMTGAGSVAASPAGAADLAASVGPDMDAHAEALFNAASAASAGAGMSLLGSAAAFVSAADRITRTEMEEGAPEDEAEEIVAQLRAQAAVAAGALGFGPGAGAALVSAAAAAARGGDRVTAALARACRLAAQARQEGGARGPELFAGLRSIKAALAHAPADGDKDDTAVPKVTAAQAAALRAARTAALAALSRPADATTAAAAAEAVAPGAAMSPAVAAAMAARDAATAAAAAAGPASKRDHQHSSGSGLAGLLADADPGVVLAAAEPILVEALAAAGKQDWEAAAAAALSGAAGRGAVSGIAGPATGAGLDLGPIALALMLAQLQLAAGRFAEAASTLAMSGAAAASLPAVLAARLRAARLSGDAACVADAEAAAVKAMAAAEAAAKAAGEGAAVENSASTLAALSAVLAAHFADSDAKRAVELALSGAAESSRLARSASRGADPAASKSAVSALLRGAGRSLSCVAADALTSGTADAAGAEELFGRVVSAAGSAAGDSDIDVDALDAAGIPDDMDEADGASGDAVKARHSTAAASGAGDTPPAAPTAASASGAGAAAAASSPAASGSAAAAASAAAADGDDDSDSQDDAGADAGAGAGTRKSREAVLRRRRRKRDEHIAALKAEAAKTGTALPRVDPDRWLPKALRGKRGRKRRKGMSVEHGGTQGAGSFDASLDARAKAASRSAAPEPVESEAKKGARGSRLPKQRMRKPRR
ncbi:hypothetical protein FNF27_02750 [Cafeteria roenbergensis]|uniref:Signal recognition particle subunit SRP72 n=1 Tax=Cafeteria roenbergensis TaxID=33653 RepID=A0A5A8EDQ2_CAFRO|nr:hypothetical protein FNF27_02750 [Cafeteria roenbergensis]